MSTNEKLAIGMAVWGAVSVSLLLAWGLLQHKFDADKEQKKV